MDGATCNCRRLGARSVYTIQPCTMSRRMLQNHKRRVHVCLAVTCHRHFWQNDRDLLRATVVPRWWNGYRNKSQHGKLTPEKKLLPLFLPQYFDRESCALTAEPPRTPYICRCIQLIHLPVLPSFTVAICFRFAQTSGEEFYELWHSDCHRRCRSQLIGHVTLACTFDPYKLTKRSLTKRDVNNTIAHVIKGKCPRKSKYF